MEKYIELFKVFLKTELKPLMKSLGFKTSGQELIKNWIIEERNRGYLAEMANKLEIKMKKDGII